MIEVSVQRHELKLFRGSPWVVSLIANEQRQRRLAITNRAKWRRRPQCQRHTVDPTKRFENARQNNVKIVVWQHHAGFFENADGTSPRDEDAPMGRNDMQWFVLRMTECMMTNIVWISLITCHVSGLFSNACACVFQFNINVSESWSHKTMTSPLRAIGLLDVSNVFRGWIVIPHASSSETVRISTVV